MHGVELSAGGVFVSAMVVWISNKQRGLSVVVSGRSTARCSLGRCSVQVVRGWKVGLNPPNYSPAGRGEDKNLA